VRFCLVACLVHVCDCLLIDRDVSDLLVGALIMALRCMNIHEASRVTIPHLAIVFVFFGIRGVLVICCTAEGLLQKKGSKRNVLNLCLIH